METIQQVFSIALKVEVAKHREQFSPTLHTSKKWYFVRLGTNAGASEPTKSLREADLITKNMTFVSLSQRGGENSHGTDQDMSKGVHLKLTRSDAGKRLAMESNGCLIEALKSFQKKMSWVNGVMPTEKKAHSAIATLAGKAKGGTPNPASTILTIVELDQTTKEQLVDTTQKYRNVNEDMANFLVEQEMIGKFGTASIKLSKLNAEVKENEADRSVLITATQPCKSKHIFRLTIVEEEKAEMEMVPNIPADRRGRACRKRKNLAECEH